jgi:hypothetical protein
MMVGAGGGGGTSLLRVVVAAEVEVELQWRRERKEEATEPFVAVWDPWARTVKMGMVTRGGRSGSEVRTTTHWTSGRP